MIDENGEQAGVVSTDDALRRARDAGLDLVEVSPNDRPPVCKIMDYGKFKYSQSKLKQKHHEQRLKELRLRPRTDEHDRDIKIEHARKFLEHGDRVQFTMMFKGRERFHQEIGQEAFNYILQVLGELAKVERPPKMEGRRMTMVLVPAKPVTVKKPAAPKAATAATKSAVRSASDARPAATGGLEPPRTAPG
ncbi:MAG: translation initiation factor IF-3 [Phycisphaerae bacterium]|nr:translation initiation factor IF-3 [Phycisphaerae bacterium]